MGGGDEQVLSTLLIAWYIVYRKYPLTPVTLHESAEDRGGGGVSECVTTTHRKPMVNMPTRHSLTRHPSRSCSTIGIGSTSRRMSSIVLLYAVK